MIERDTAGRPPPPRGDLLDDVYRRVVELHYALAVADRLDEDLHRRSLEKLMDVLTVIDAGRRDGATGD